MEVREARPEDYPAVGELTVAAYRDGGHLTVDAAVEYANELRDAETRAAKADLLVAVDTDGVVLGTVTFCVSGSPLAEVCVDGEGEFRMLAVPPAAQGRGVGEALVRACLDRARALGCEAVAMCSRSDVAPAAIRLYERLGFVRVPERDWSPAPGIPLIGWRITL